MMQSQNQYHEMPGNNPAPSYHPQPSPQMASHHSPQMQGGGSELSASDAPTLNNQQQGQPAGQGQGGGTFKGLLMNFLVYR
jgi:hypothetical protein